MDKIVEALGPWPILQLIFGCAVLGVGVFATIKGLAGWKGDGHPSQWEAQQEWEAYQRLENIERHTEMIAENQKLMLDRITLATETIKQMSNSINTLVSALWNRSA